MFVIGISLCSFCVIWVLVRYAYTVVGSSYWASQALVRSHLFSGTVSSLLSPYFIYQLAIREVLSVWIGLAASVAVAIVCITGMGLCSRIGSSDYPLLRNFITNALGILVGVIMWFGFALLHQGGGGFTFLVSIIFALALVVQAAVVYLLIIEGVSFFGKHEGKNNLILSGASFGRLGIKNIVQIFRLGSRHGTQYYSHTSKKALFLSTTFPLFIAAINVGVILMNVLWCLVCQQWHGYERSIEFMLVALPYLNSVSAWGMFEITLFARGRSSIKVAVCAAVITAGIAAFALPLLVTSWFQMGFFKALKLAYFF